MADLLHSGHATSNSMLGTIFSSTLYCLIELTEKNQLESEFLTWQGNVCRVTWSNWRQLFTLDDIDYIDPLTSSS